jgi:hypothetical protein
MPPGRSGRGPERGGRHSWPWIRATPGPGRSGPGFPVSARSCARHAPGPRGFRLRDAMIAALSALAQARSKRPAIRRWRPSRNASPGRPGPRGPGFPKPWTRGRGPSVPWRFRRTLAALSVIGRRAGAFGQGRTPGQGKLAARRPGRPGKRPRPPRRPGRPNLRSGRPPRPGTGRLRQGLRPGRGPPGRRRARRGQFGTTRRS